MLEELYCVHAPLLRRYCAAMCADATTAEDVTQETFVRAMCHLDDLEALDSGQRRAWLYRTARNLYLDQCRRKTAAQRKIALLFQEEAGEDALSSAETDMLLACLPYDLRELMRRRYLEGYNATELAEMYGMPPATVRSKLRQARLLLQKSLAEA